MIIDNVDNLNKLSSDLEEKGFYAELVININTSIGDHVMKIVIILIWITCILSFSILILTSLKRIQEKKKDFAILKTIGYSNNNIMSLLYMNLELLV